MNLTNFEEIIMNEVVRHLINEPNHSFAENNFIARVQQIPHKEDYNKWQEKASEALESLQKKDYLNIKPSPPRRFIVTLTDKGKGYLF